MKSMARKWIERRDSDPTIGVAYNWNKRILVVDDEPEIRETYKDVLSPTNKKVLPIRSSRSAILPPNEVDPGFEFDVTLCSSYKEAIEVFGWLAKKAVLMQWDF